MGDGTNKDIGPQTPDEGSQDVPQIPEKKSEVDSVLEILTPYTESNKGVIDEDIRNCVSKLTSTAYLWQSKGKDQKEIDELLNRGLNKIKDIKTEFWEKDFPERNSDSLILMLLGKTMIASNDDPRTPSFVTGKIKEYRALFRKPSKE